MTNPITLTGKTLTPAELSSVSDGAAVALAPEGLAAMAQTHDALSAAVAEGRPMYGITTGLGPRVVEALDTDAQRRMSQNTVRGRAHAVGTPLPVRTVRGSMAVRLNTLLIGASGAAPDLAQLIADCLNAGVTPIVRETGSIGAADLIWGGSMGLPLIGEGEMDTPNGPCPAAQALNSAGLKIYDPGPREGLALANHSSFSAALAALGLTRARKAFGALQTAAAMSLEGFGANLTPFEAEILALHPQPGQARAASQILTLLEGSALREPGNARRVQDPLSLRNIPQVHGAVLAALDQLDEAVTTEINGAPDNPAVLAGTGDVLSTGAYLPPWLAIALTAANHALTHLAAAATARMSRQMHPRLTELPPGLGTGDVDSTGFSPAMKVAEALAAEIAHLAQPAPIYPAAGADTIEDLVTHVAIPAKALNEISHRLDRLAALELMIGAQHVECRAPARVPERLTEAIARVRAHVAPLTEDRALAEDIEILASRVGAGDFSAP